MNTEVSSFRGSSTVYRGIFISGVGIEEFHEYRGVLI